MPGSWTVQVPGCERAHGTVRYTRSFTVPRSWPKHDTLVLRFGAVNHAAEVLLNGHHLGAHEGGWTPFEVVVDRALLTGDQERLEVVVPRAARRSVLQALRSAHPYEEPAYDLLELVTPAGRRGLGRVGELPAPTPLRALTERAAQVLPATAGGVRSAGDPDRVVRTLAVCGGSGDSLLREAGRAADAYLTADLRHHPASEAPEGLALLDAAHWATEHPWLADAARRLTSATTVEAVVSDRVTDPWTHSAR